MPLVGRPFITYMLEWLRGHGVDDAILSCGFMADGVRHVLGGGEALGVRLQYAQEPRPLGTGGALKFAEDLLQERFLMLNGDVLADVNLTELLQAHERTGARVTVGLIAVEDPSAYGLVRRAPDGAVTEFVEKPSPDEVDTDLISLGAYVIEREVLEELPPSGSRLSIERDVFPELVGRGLYGQELGGYWLDIGTPQRYLQATFDILEGDVRTEVGRRLMESGGTLQEGDATGIAGQVHAPVMIGPDCVIAPGATVGGRTVIGRAARIESGAHVVASVLLPGCSVGAGSRISAAILGPGVTVEDHCRIDGGVVLGENVKVGAGNTLTSGIRIFPGVELPDGAVAF
jgi:mannose-1-phosphate guanylyltransferase